ncbi:MAG TPA: hypothetical protein DEH78_24090, partial [Solibacterales bacterium]|nr:hypothetical protein [Bryobacterales bacterium]
MSSWAGSANRRESAQTIPSEPIRSAVLASTVVTSEQVRHWFGRAAEIPAVARPAYMRDHCTNTRVRSEVLALLEYDSDGFTQPASIVREAIGALRDAPGAQRVGPFEITRLLGSGGMGAVYEAQRVDGEVRQRVAVKFAQAPVLAGEPARENAHRRFCRERQMLASLRHPYIAGLIDAGATEDGVPYAVIEQVDGAPIDVYCAQSLAEQSEVIRLVLKLCEAVQFAHRNLVVHSDIKPENVLVTADGLPKLIDFGIASDLSPEAALTSARGFTPAYASPEQALGLAPTVATDVYGIGAVLYRLLTGSAPRTIRGGSLSQAIRQIAEEDVARPSSLRPHLRGDLENILLKALHREPERRYGSAPELAEDLNRFLERRPVHATPDSTLYRARRFASRHWAILSLVAALAATLIFATAAAWKQRAVAIDRAAESRRLAEKLLFEVHDEIDGVIGATKAREKLGAIAVEYLERLGRERGDDPELAWERMNAYARLARSRGGAAASTGDTASALAFASRALDLGAAVEARLTGGERRNKLFGLYQSLVPVFHESGHTAEHKETVNRLLRLAEGLDPARKAQAFLLQARYLDSVGARTESTEAFGQALALLRARPEKAAPDHAGESQLVSTLVGYGRAQALDGDFPGALASLQEAVREAARHSAAAPHIVRYSRQLYWSHIALGDLLGSPARFHMGRPAAAMEQYGQARALAERLVAADPHNDAAKLDLARALGREAALLTVAQPERALERLNRAEEQVSATSAGNEYRPEWRFDLLIASVEPLARLRRFDLARAQLDEAGRLIQPVEAAGKAVNRSAYLRAGEMLLHLSERTPDALAAARANLPRAPMKANPTLGEAFDTLERLARIRIWAA